MLKKVLKSVREKESSFRELGAGGATCRNASEERFRVWRSQVVEEGSMPHCGHRVNKFS